MALRYKEQSMEARTVFDGHKPDPGPTYTNLNSYVIFFISLSNLCFSLISRCDVANISKYILHSTMAANVRLLIATLCNIVTITERVSVSLGTCWPCQRGLPSNGREEYNLYPVNCLGSAIHHRIARGPSFIIYLNSKLPM